MSLFKSWIDVAGEEEFAASDRKQVFLADGREVGLYRVDGAYYAVSNTCPHANASMIGGFVEGFELECPLHGARFDLRDGRVLVPPAVRGLSTFAVRLENGRIQIKV